MRGLSLALSIVVFSVACPAASARIFVEPFPAKPGAEMLREEIVNLLSKEAGIAVVPEASQADYIVAGSGETYVRGYVGTNPRVHYLNRDAKPIYGGFLSVELKPRGQDTVWSYLATPSRLGPQDINLNLARQVEHKLAELALKGVKP